jgi:hypothetical protein
MRASTPQGSNPMSIAPNERNAVLYAVAIRGMNYVIIDTRNGAVQKPAYITRASAEKACAEKNEEN